MKNSEFKVLEKCLISQLPGFQFKGPLVFLAPVRELLAGFCFESTGLARDSFYLWSFFQPLFVPAKEIRLTFGHRLENGRRWINREPDLEPTLLLKMRNEIPNLVRLNSPKAIASALEVFTKPNAMGYVNPHCREAFAYALARAGQIDRAIEVIEALLRTLEKAVGWQLELASRVARMQQLFLNRPQEAMVQLTNWEYETARNLGLENFLGKGA